MDGRWKRWACGGVIAAAVVGCNRNEVRAPVATPEFAAVNEKPSLIQQAFGTHPKFVPKPPADATAVPVKVARNPNEPAKPETHVALAEADFEAAFMEGRSAVERDQFLDAARHKYQLALKADPKNKAALTGLARLYAKIDDRQHAVATLQTAVQAHPKDHELAHKLAGVQVQFADWAGAAESCRLALRLDPENRSYHKTLGYCQAQLGQWDEAFATLLKTMPEPQARYFLGRVMLDLGQTDQGKQLIAAAAAMDPEYKLAKQTLDDMTAGRLNRQEPVTQAGFDAAAPK